jgi:hypothetical protein
LAIVAADSVRAEDTSFANQVAPILRERCVGCHNNLKARGGLKLTSRELLLTGGKSGPAIVPGDAARSLLMTMISGDEPAMPKQAAPLSKKHIDSIRKWIDAGAVWPGTITLDAGKDRPRVGPEWWSLKPLVQPLLPTGADLSWARTPIDAFIAAALEARGMRPSAAADRRTLIRRVTFDLHGLPPTVAEVEAFVNDPAADAYEKVVERLLASPAYGERWARHWLDVVHYGDTHGYDKDKRRDNAWPYRDYVIRALNSDKPYSRFVQEQIAGDVLFPDDPEGVIATGFIAAGPWDFVGHVELREGTVDKEKTRAIDRDDMVTNTISSFLSLTAHCARCHDHTFDPIPRREYYRLQAVFAGIDRGDRPYGTKPAATTNSKPTQVYAALPLASGPRPIYDLNRGDVEQKGELVRPGALSCVAGLDADFKPADPKNEGLRRAALAQWIASPGNVLTWRSIVNRVWHYHFGRGLVDTPSDFGWNGGRPSHPELLDWLAAHFRDGTQSLKDLHRMIVLSATYQQAPTSGAEYARLDADNRYLWRTNRLRLDAEEIRDSVLAVSGQLDRRMGGPGFELFRFVDDHSPIYDHGAVNKINDPAAWRRTVYRFTVRSVPNPFLECMDCADPNINTPVRTATLTALQALALLNDPFMLKQAEFFAARLQGDARTSGEQIDLAYRLAFGRPASAEEKMAVGEYAARNGLANACRLLFNANEFVFVD